MVAVMLMSVALVAVLCVVAYKLAVYALPFLLGLTFKPAHAPSARVGSSRHASQRRIKITLISRTIPFHDSPHVVQS